jgi:enoyl-CoA hydratase/carnithine racemase
MPYKYESLTVCVSEAVAEVELCRPEVLNRFDSVLHREFGAALVELAADEEVLAVLLCSTGRFFSAGGDSALMTEAATDVRRRLALVDEGRRLFSELMTFAKPLVVALEGDSHGVGTTIALSADALFAHPQVRITDAHVRSAVAAGDGGVAVWPANMPAVLARRHLLTGDPLEARTAHRLGIVTDLVETREEVRPAARAFADRLAGLPPLGVQLTKRALNAAFAHRVSETLDVGFYLEALALGTEDVREALTAFAERRPGKWTGS